MFVNHRIRLLFAAALVAAVLVFSATISRAATVSPSDILTMKLVAEVAIRPDASWIAYTVRVPRAPDDEAGPDYRELHLVSAAAGESRPFVTGKVTVYDPSWSPDGSAIAFRMRRGKDAKTQVWTIPFDGGEATEATHSKANVLAYRWRPGGKQIAYVAETPEAGREKKLSKAGYGFTFFEEALKDRNLYMTPTKTQDAGEPRQLTQGVSIWSLEFSPDGNTIAVGATPKNLIDQHYMETRIHLLDVRTGDLKQLSKNSGKLGNFAFSPDGTRIVYAAARDIHDHAVSHAYVMDVAGGSARDVTPEGLRGHIEWVGWKDNKTVVYRAAEGVWNTLGTVSAGGGKPTTLLHAKEQGVVFGALDVTGGLQHAAMIGTSPDIPADVYYWKPGKSPRRLTTLNAWVADRDIGRQDVVHYSARDGLGLEALLVYPVGYETGKRYPTVVVVHGGPESHYSNGWLTYYSAPVQILAAEGYVVFLPNYRSSTGYGVDFTRDHLGDAAGKEFDDIADGIDYLVQEGVTDRDRVGLMGGSYGGYAAAWFSSYYTKYVRAVCMFVGISDLISKRGTTDIPYEELYVHSGKKLEEMWDLSLERSPIYYAHQSKTAVLIYGGAADPRVHPSQSIEYYRRLKMNDHPAVRLVQYPGEGHGNAKQPGRIDVLYRTLDWMNWYVKDAKPLDGPMPPLDISDRYGLTLGE